MKKTLLGLLSLILALGMVAACNGAAAETTSTAALPTGTPDAVNLTYFYESDACFCLHLAGQWITDTVHNDYKTQLDSGKLTYAEYDTKDANNKVRMTEFNATSYAFFITVNKDGQPVTHSVNGLWLYTDSSGTNELLKSKFIGLLKKEIDKALAGG
jgi:hypothetical protein